MRFAWFEKKRDVPLLGCLGMIVACIVIGIFLSFLVHRLSGNQQLGWLFFGLSVVLGIPVAGGYSLVLFNAMGWRIRSRLGWQLLIAYPLLFACNGRTLGHDTLGQVGWALLFGLIGLALAADILRRLMRLPEPTAREPGEATGGAASTSEGDTLDSERP